jgi:hypothetical protein
MVHEERRERKRKRKIKNKPLSEEAVNMKSKGMR